VRKPCLRLYGNKAEAWLQQSISVLNAAFVLKHPYFACQMPHPYFACRSIVSQMPNLFVTRFNSSCSDTATIQTFIFDTALAFRGSILDSVVHTYIYSTYHGQVWLNDSQIREPPLVDSFKKRNAGISPHFLLRVKMGPRQ
jgi:hypothetical protein